MSWKNSAGIQNKYLYKKKAINKKDHCAPNQSTSHAAFPETEVER
jgi:hypothetical protein